MSKTHGRFSLRHSFRVPALVLAGLAFVQSLHAQTTVESSLVSPTRAAFARVGADTCSDQIPRVAIMSSQTHELENLRRETQITGTCVLNGHRHYLGRLAGHDVVLLLAGYSMVNASMTTQALLDHFAVREIVFSGIAGGVNPNLNIGDVIVPAEWGQYQEQVFARKVPGGWDSRGDSEEKAVEFSNYGMMFPRRVPVTRRNGEPDKQERRFWFSVNAQALETLRSIAPQVALSRCADNAGCLKTTPKLVIGGYGVSGQTFVDNAAYRRWVWRTFHADALDMETAAVATVAYVNEVPFIAFRSLSDLAGGGKEKNEISVFFKLAADNSAAVVLAYLKASQPK
jgi:adenosylhomocysteine nucleosidase